MKSKTKYWYRIDIDQCVLCGYEHHMKHRVYNEHEKGTHVRDYACATHFL